jgi:hypothetical protein
MSVNKLVSHRKPALVLGLAVTLSVVLYSVGVVVNQGPHEFAAVFSTVNYGEAGSCVEMVALTAEETRYVFAKDYPEPSFCSPVSSECSVVIWGYSGIPPRPDSLEHRNRELFGALLELRPFQLKQDYPSLSNAGATGWFDIKMNDSAGMRHRNVTAKAYYPFDKQNEFYQVFDYMRGLKKDILFTSQEHNFIACVNELEESTVKSTFAASPHWKDVKLAMIAYLAVNRYQPARPVLERLLKSETDAQVVISLKAALLFFPQ